MTGRYALESLNLPLMAQFQSSPGLMTGRYLAQFDIELKYREFQSSPGLMTGRYVAAACNMLPNICFNPRPA